MWTQRDGTEIHYGEMTRHHAWNAERMLLRNGYDVPLPMRAIVGDVRGLLAVWYHTRNILWLLTHPWKIERGMLRGV